MLCNFTQHINTEGNTNCHMAILNQNFQQLFIYIRIKHQHKLFLSINFIKPTKILHRLPIKIKLTQILHGFQSTHSKYIIRNTTFNSKLKMSNTIDTFNIPFMLPTLFFNLKFFLFCLSFLNPFYQQFHHNQLKK